ncbi:hypothetical protein lerEdw1_008150 [Lerista edwardsae]|nr:hypothetical protein lerEdw1_008150 [Lerista edwardsae]
MLTWTLIPLYQTRRTCVELIGHEIRSSQWRACTDVEALVEDIRKAEPLITASRKDQVVNLVLRLQEKLGQQVDHKFYLFKVLRAHILPLTNVAFNKSGSCFITGSYDRTCKLWDTASGEELRSLEGHRNVVYAIAFNNPYGDKIATGSFDKTCKLWSVETGKCYYTFRGHTAEIVSKILPCLAKDSGEEWDFPEKIVKMVGFACHLIFKVHWLLLGAWIPQLDYGTYRMEKKWSD